MISLLLALLCVQPAGVSAAPPAPTGLAATATRNSITVTWDAVSGMEDSAGNTKYGVSLTKPDGSGADAYTSVTNKTSHTFNGLTPGTRYTCNVVCYDMNSERSDPAQVPCTTAAALAAPVVTNIEPSSNSVSISWNPVSGATGYVVGKPMIYVIIVPIIETDLTSCVIEDLISDTEYTFRLAAVDGDGSGEYYDFQVRTLVNNTTEPLRAPLVETIAEKNYVALFITGDTGTDTLTISRATGPDKTFTTIRTLSGGTGICTDGGLSPNTEYTYMVGAARKGGEPVYTTVTVTTPVTGQIVSVLPDQPTGFRLVQTGADYVELKWDAAEFATNYRITEQGGQISEIVINSPTVTSCRIPGLKSDTSYTFLLSASNSLGNSESASLNVHTLKTESEGTKPAIPDPPGSLTVTGVSDATVTLRWDAVPGAAGYRVYRSTSRDSGYTAVAETSSTTYTDSGLKSSTTYYYRVCSYNSKKELSKESNTAEATTEHAKVPAAPTGLRAVLRDGALTLTWSAVGNAQSYRIYRSDAADGEYTLLATANGVNRYVITEATDDDLVWYKVSAVNTAGESPKSDAVHAELAEGEILPLPIWYEELTSESVVIRWDGIEGAAGYYVYRTGMLNGEYELLKETQELQYSDLSLEGGATTFYMVIAYDEENEEIAVSDVLAVEAPQPTAGTDETAKEDTGNTRSAALIAAIRKALADPMTAALGIAIVATILLLVTALVMRSRRDKKKARRTMRSKGGARSMRRVRRTSPNRKHVPVSERASVLSDIDRSA